MISLYQFMNPKHQSCDNPFDHFLSFFSLWNSPLKPTVYPCKMP
jgi:hypothetical protein